MCRHSWTPRGRPDPGHIWTPFELTATDWGVTVTEPGSTVTTVPAETETATGDQTEVQVPGAAPPGTVTERANPLRDPQDRRLPRIPEPCALVIFGVTGDLARKKLIPAVYDLANRGLLPPGFVVLGFARRDWGDGDFEELARSSAQQHARTPWREEVWSRLVGNVKFVVWFLRRRRGVRPARCPTLEELRATHGIPGNAAFYLSIPPPAFPMVLSSSKADGDGRQRPASGGWRRVVVEKPFGRDLDSARATNASGRQRVHRAPTCSGSTTTWARRLFRTSLPYGSPTPLFEPVWDSHYSTPRSPWPRTWGSAGGPSSTSGGGRP